MKVKKTAALVCAAALAVSLFTACADNAAVSNDEITESAVTEQSAPASVQPSAENGLSENEQRLLAAIEDEAEQRVDAAGSAVTLPALVPDYISDDEYPSVFDLRSVDTDGDGKTENYVTSVKQQRPFGSCWAFATVSAAETSILYELGKDSVTEDEDGNLHDTVDLSEHQLAWFVYTPVADGSQAGEGLVSQVDGVEENPSLRMGSGSTQYAASAFFASGSGPADEPDFDTAEGIEKQLNYHGAEYLTGYNEKFGVTCYSDEDDWSVDESLRFRNDYLLEDSYFLTSPVSFDESGEYDIDYADRVSATYKEQIINGRPVSIAFHSDSYRPDKEDAAAEYINSDGGTWAHYCYDNVRANHAVTIIGWDDDYPASSFLTEVCEKDSDGNILLNEDGTVKKKTVSQPPADGAWIVKNSWGSSDSIGQGINDSEWGVDGSGYFYLSYYDQSIETAVCFDFDADHSLDRQFGDYSVFQYDYLPTEIPHSVTTEFPVASANVFAAENDMTIRAVSCITTECDEELTFEIFLMNGESKDDISITPLCEFSESFPAAGLHVVTLPDACSVKAGERYAVAVTQHTDDGFLFSTVSEYNQKGFDKGLCDDNYAANAVVNAEESYIYLAKDNRWWDFSEVKEILENSDGATSYLTYDNFPIKVYVSAD